MINNDKVANQYKVLMKKLGVSISEAKTHVSKDTYEFAKRWISAGREITGLPLGGLIRNINDPKVAYTIVSEYFERMNIYHSVKQFISLCYNGYYIPKLGKFNFYRVMKYLYHYDVAVRFRRGLLTQDQLRSYIVGQNPAMDQLPSDLIPLLRESFVKGSQNLLSKSINGMMKVNKKLLTFYPDSEADASLIYSSPLINSISNYIDNCIKQIELVVNIDDPVEVLDAMSGIVLPDLDKLVLQVRDVQKRTTILDKVWRNSIRELVKYNPSDQYFGSAMETEERTLNLSGLVAYSINNLKFAKLGLNPILNKT